MVIRFKPLIASLAISVGVGALSGMLTSNSKELYESLNQPSLSPPSILFPIMWSILFILMGISAYLVYVSDAPQWQKQTAYLVYGFQLGMNFLWSIFFFNFQWFLFSFIWLIILWLLILLMVVLFYRINKPAGLLQIPYLLWVTFAGYLNLFIYLLN